MRDEEIAAVVTPLGWVDTVGGWEKDGYVLRDEGPRGFSLWIIPANGAEDVYLGDYDTIQEIDDRVEGR